MMPRLQAQESIDAANRVAMGAGRLTKESARETAAKWEQQAQPAQPKDRAIAAQKLGAMGIRVRRVTKPS